MQRINRKKVKIKYLIGFKKDEIPEIEGLLYEIVSFLEENERMDGEINNWEILNKTTYRVNNSIEEDIKELIDKGYLEQGKYTKYKVISHPWI